MLELNMEAFNMSHPSHLGRAYESRVIDLLISCQAADNEFNVNGINIDNVLVTGLSTNSQDVEPGDVFIALNGLNANIACRYFSNPNVRHLVRVWTLTNN